MLTVNPNSHPNQPVAAVALSHTTPVFSIDSASKTLHSAYDKYNQAFNNFLASSAKDRASTEAAFDAAFARL